MKTKDATYFDRDLSWLRFNHRVLQEAGDHRNPLYERIKFLAIFSSNLDEFYKVRVSAIRQIKSLDKELRKKLITKPNKLLKKIKKEVDKQQSEFGRIYTQEILPELATYGIRFLDSSNFTNEHQIHADDIYHHSIKPHLKIELANIIETDSIFIENELIYLVGEFDKDRLIWIRIKDLKRFYDFPSSGAHLYCLVEDLIKYHFTKEYKITLYGIKISRDAQLYIENEYDGDLLEKIEKSLSNRDTGQVTRALYDQSMPEDLLESIKNALNIYETDLVKGSTYHRMKDFFEFQNPTDHPLNFEPLPPLLHHQEKVNHSIIDSIFAKDRIYYFPYHSFDDVIQLVTEASQDPNVTRIKVTLYRVSKDSAIGHALLQALDNNKKVTAFIETKARFDEANNIQWGKKLEKKGAKVIYSYPDIKVHSKLIYIEKVIDDKKQRIAYIGTGNLNEKTAKIYTDFGLMTAHKQITKEVRSIFQLLEKKLIIPKLKELIVSPFNSRNVFSELIEKEIDRAENGQAAYIILKMNSLEDKKLIKQLYRASNAGVHIKLIIRGICCLVPGVANMSENITVVSIIDRYLEHARVFIFSNGGDELIYMGSADWMTRNIDKRIEVITPLWDEHIKTLVRQIINLQLEDNIKGRLIDSEQKNEYLGHDQGDSSQHKTYQLIKNQLESTSHRP